MTNAASTKLILDYVYEHEEEHPSKTYLTQPLGHGKVVDYSWGEVLEQARRMATYLKSQGCGEGTQVAILSKNCAYFFMAELAIWMAGGTTVSIFPTESAETIRYVLEHSEAKMIFIGKLDTWQQQSAGVPAHVARIIMPLAPRIDGAKWEEILVKNRPIAGKPARKPDDLAMLIYTSGSTGQPKGVMHNFQRITRAVESVINVSKLQPEERFISYLPLAHVVERTFVECGTLIGGGHVFFADSLATFMEDVKRARPTIFLSVPRLWLKFQEGVLAQMPAKKLDFLLKIPVIKKIVSRKVLEGLGLDQARLAGSGTAPIPAELLAWYQRLGLNLLEGYGMTEDFACSHLSSDAHHEIGFVGVACPGVQVRISDDGEVLIKSPGQLVGYFKRPELTQECFTEDGFFRTGDQGYLRADGMLKITGRLKEIFKTGKGKYVAPAPIENQLNAHPLIELSLVSGVGKESAYAMVLLKEERRIQLLQAASEGSKQRLLRSQMEAQLEQLLADVNQELVSYEQLHMLVVVSDPWTIENGCLTPTMKIKRSRIEAKVTEQLDGWYASGKKVVWF